MTTFMGVMGLVAVLSFGAGSTLALADDPMPAPTDGKDKKETAGPKALADDKKGDKKEDQKGGK